MTNKNTLLERRELLTKGLVAGTAVVGAGGAWFANTTGHLPVDISVINTADPLHIQRVSQLDVKLVNNGSQPIDPSFSTIRESQQTRFYWDVTTTGKQTISPSETKRYHLRATNPGMAIEYDESYVLLTEDMSGSRGITIKNHTHTANELVTIRNPSLNSWLVPIQTGKWSPFRWNNTTYTKGGDSVAVTKVKHGARFNVARGNRSGPWTMAGLSQRVPFIDSLQMAAIPGVLTKPSKFQSGVVCGLEVVDRNYRIWVVYSNVPKRTHREFNRGELEYHVEYIPAARGQQTRFNLNLTQVYKERGWKYPPSRAITIDGNKYQASAMALHPFTAAYSSGNSATMELIKITPSTTKH